MDILEYLQHKEKRFEKRASRLRDLGVFDFNYVPERPVMRDELKPVIDALLRYEKTGIANHLLIVGSRGCGKTLSVLHLQRLFERRGLNVLYANCRTYNTSYKILAYLLGVRARGTSFAELAEQFAERYSDKSVVVLDEVDLLSEKDKKRDILYFLSRSQRNYMAVMLSNSPKWETTLDASTQSTMQPEVLYFRPYTPAELGQILEQRAELGVRHVPASVLKKIAALTVKYTNADTRVAIKTLYHWATEPEVGLEQNFQRARRDIVVDVIRNLHDASLLILKAAAGADRPVKEVYERYRQLCSRYQDQPYSYVYFYATLSFLQSLGLVLLISTKIRRAYTKVMQLTFPAEMIDTVWGLRFG